MVICYIGEGYCSLIWFVYLVYYYFYVRKIVVGVKFSGVKNLRDFFLLFYCFIMRY